MERDLAFIVTSLVVILLGLSFHEFAHAKFADLAGDPTPRLYGRVTINPIAHLDPMGTLMILVTTFTGFGIGWGKPVPMNPMKMRNPRWDHFAAVAAGPISNLIQATLYAVVLRVMAQVGDGHMWDQLFGGALGPVLTFLALGVIINLALCFFNLIPLGPLDGHWMLGTFMPETTRFKWYMWNRQVGGFVFLALVIFGQMNPQFNLIGAYLRPAVQWGFRFLVGA